MYDHSGWNTKFFKKFDYIIYGMPKEVRETIELLCSILSENGVAHVKAETLRKAKFDHPDVVC